MKKQFGKLEPGDKIVMFNQIFVVQKVEVSEKGMKQGRTKARVEVKSQQGEEKVIIRLAKEQVEVV